MHDKVQILVEHFIKNETNSIVGYNYKKDNYKKKTAKLTLQGITINFITDIQIRISEV